MKIKIPIYFVLLFAVLVFVVAYFSFHSERAASLAPVKSDIVLEAYNQPDYKLTKPFLLLDLFGEDSALVGLKVDVQNFIAKQRATGKLLTASVYVRKLSKGKWFTINPTETYSAGSIMKLMVLLTYMRMSENNPGLLDSKIDFIKHFNVSVVATIVTTTLMPGRSYSVRELLRAMIVNSDNDATILLNMRKDGALFNKLLNNLNMPIPVPGQQDYPMDVVQCSRFLRILYASTFLTPENSEFALELLSHSDFKDGLIKSIPDTITVAHKFGERNFPDGFQLHETGVVYANESPYLITVMTKGSDQAILSQTIDGISGLVYRYMVAQP